MELKSRYINSDNDKIDSDLILHKNQKGYHIKLDGKFYFPNRDNLVLKNLDKFKDKELWVAIISDDISYGNFAFVVPDYFVRENYNNEVYIEKEIPLNIIKEGSDNCFSWDYVNLGSIKSQEDSDRFIDDMESLKVPEKIIKEALNLFYYKINNKN